MNGLDIKNFREANRMTQPQLAALLGVSHQTVQNWEAGKVIPKTKEAMLASIIYGGNTGTIINGQNHNSGSIDNRQYYSDSPDALRAQIEALDERIKEKDAQIKEKDAQIKEKKDAQINRLLDILSKR